MTKLQEVILPPDTIANQPAASVDGRLYFQTDGLLQRDNGASWDDYQATTGGGGYIGYMVIQEQQTANTAGGTFTTGAYRTRVLNTEALDSNNDVTLASNQLTFVAGDYDCEIVCPAFHVNQHKARLRNVTDGVTLLVGTSEWQDAADPGTQSHSFIAGRFTIGASKAVEVQHACSATQATNGFGVQANLTEVEVYTVARFFRVS